VRQVELVEEQSLIAETTAGIVLLEEIDKLNTRFKLGILTYLFVLFLDGVLHLGGALLNRVEAFQEVVVDILVVVDVDPDEGNHVVCLFEMCSAELVHV